MTVDSSSRFDNELSGEPSVQCEESMVSLTFKTKKPFTGRVYVSGLADDSRCARNFARNADQSTVSIKIQNGDCTMSRQRVSGKLEVNCVLLTTESISAFLGNDGLSDNCRLISWNVRDSG
jgi:hypothetical protein